MTRKPRRTRRRGLYREHVDQDKYLVVCAHSPGVALEDRGEGESEAYSDGHGHGGLKDPVAH